MLLLRFDEAHRNDGAWKPLVITMYRRVVNHCTLFSFVNKSEEAFNGDGFFE
jgi:hypothetical protein